VIGYFGKIPSHGDFVSRGLPPALVEAWDAWLQQCIHESQRQLGDQWLTHYLTSPVWRFAIAPGILGPEGLGGVMMPSVDRVGRYFPLMLAATGAPALLDWFQKQAAWYDGIEEVARASLNAGFRLEQFDGVVEPGMIPSTSFMSMGCVQRFLITEDVDERIIAAAFQNRSLWWTEGSPSVEASVLSCVGMPSAQAFTVMLDGIRIAIWRSG
jgi:type VI secretion system protein ImpM